MGNEYYTCPSCGEKGNPEFCVDEGEKAKFDEEYVWNKQHTSQIIFVTCKTCKLKAPYDVFRR